MSNQARTRARHRWPTGRAVLAGGAVLGRTYSGPSVFGLAHARGEMARAHEESMPAPCDAGFAGAYDVNHNRPNLLHGRAAR